MGAWFDEFAYADEPTESFVEKLALLTDATHPVDKRIEEATTRVKAAETLRHGLHAVQTMLKNVTSLPEDERNFDEDDIESLAKVTEKALAWIDEKEAAQVRRIIHVFLFLIFYFFFRTQRPSMPTPC